MTGKNIYDFKNSKCKKNYSGNLTVLGEKISKEKTWKSILGYGCQPLLDGKSKEKRYIYVCTTIITEDEAPFYDGDRLLKLVFDIHYREPGGFPISDEKFEEDIKNILVILREVK